MHFYTWCVGEYMQLNIVVFLIHLSILRMGWLSIAKILVEEKNADPNFKNEKGETILHETCR